MAKSRTRRKQAGRDPGRAARPARDLGRRVGQQLEPEQPRAPEHDRLELGNLVELQPGHDAEPVAQRRGEQARPGRCAHQRERRQIEPDRAGRRTFADHQVELVVLHRRIEDLLDRRLQPVDLVDEQHVARLQVGEDRSEIAGPLDDRPGGQPEAHTQLGRHDLRQRRLAQPRRPGEQDMVERVAAGARGLDEHGEVGAQLGLTDELHQPPRAAG